MSFHLNSPFHNIVDSLGLSCLFKCWLSNYEEQVVALTEVSKSLYNLAPSYQRQHDSMYKTLCDINIAV